MGTNGKLVIDYMKDKQYKILAINLVGLEGIADDGVLNEDTSDQWNDTIMVVKNTGEVLLEANGTTEPGRYYTENRLNPNGVARLAIKQHVEAWEFGYHNYDLEHPALVQTAPVTVYRDNNEDYSRVGDVVDTGLFGINIHGTKGYYDYESIGRWSAGCIVTRNWNNHLTMLQRMKDSGQTYITFTLIDGSDLAKYAKKKNQPLAL